MHLIAGPPIPTGINCFLPHIPAEDQDISEDIISTVFRTSKNISAQIIDDKNHKTLVSASSLEKKLIKKGKKGDLSNSIAELLAKRALEKKITKVFFDRGRYKYHGRIKIFAETLRKNGLNF